MRSYTSEGPLIFMESMLLLSSLLLPCREASVTLLDGLQVSKSSYIGHRRDIADYGVMKRGISIIDDEIQHTLELRESIRLNKYCREIQKTKINLRPSPTQEAFSIVDPPKIYPLFS